MEPFSVKRFSDLHGLLDSIYNPILAIDTQGTIIFCNPAMATIAGGTLKNIIGRRVEDVVTHSRLRRIIETGRAESVQKIEIAGRIYISNRSPLMVADALAGAVAVLQDISELASVADELEATRQLSEEFQAIIESSFDGIFVTDGQGKVIRLNKAYERITGISRHDVVGRTMQELVDEGVYNQSVTLKVLSSQKPESLVQTIKTGKTVMVTGTPIFDDDRQVRLVVTSVRDVTELHNLQNKLMRAEKLRSMYENELEQLRQGTDNAASIVVRSKKMQAVHKMALRLANVDTTILVQGESGVGKEVFADMVHANNQRRGRPLVKISCAAIPEQLLESELFGYTPAAFTGASPQGKTGVFEAAAGGTIFLDEIGEMPLGLQAKLLRVLQSKEVVRLGSSTPIPVDVRIIAATNRDLRDMVQRGEYRSDLFFRLSVVPVTIPPLRERKDAIPNLIYHFLDRYNQKYGFGKQIDPTVLRRLYDYDWPGNVRELGNTVERLVVTTSGDIITPADLPDKFKTPDTMGEAPVMLQGTLKATLNEVERKLLADALALHGSTHKMARALGLNQSTVVRKLQRYNLSPGKSGDRHQGSR
ncbi:PAS modulated sigma54 specific transcriptional regulator, Fis family [Desulfosarcina variabilis str. Montpellier]|uniref:sigma 54-interacting transcriptional regulator n=1 Tax=Desulfosarcina variabilis TaxID=2300 RepID=UPI003AFB3BB9